MFHAVPQIQRAGWVAQRNIIARVGRVNTRGLVAAWSEREERGAAQVCASCKMSRGLPSPRAACREHGRGTSSAPRHYVSMAIWIAWSMEHRYKETKADTSGDHPDQRERWPAAGRDCTSLGRKKGAPLGFAPFVAHAHHDNSKCCCYCRRHFFSDLHFE